MRTIQIPQPFQVQTINNNAIQFPVAAQQQNSVQQSLLQPFYSHPISRIHIQTPSIIHTNPPTSPAPKREMPAHISLQPIISNPQLVDLKKQNQELNDKLQKQVNSKTALHTQYEHLLEAYNSLRSNTNIQLQQQTNNNNNRTSNNNYNNRNQAAEQHEHRRISSDIIVMDGAPGSHENIVEVNGSSLVMHDENPQQELIHRYQEHIRNLETQSQQRERAIKSKYDEYIAAMRSENQELLDMNNHYDQEIQKLIRELQSQKDRNSKIESHCDTISKTNRLQQEEIMALRQQVQGMERDLEYASAINNRQAEFYEREEYYRGELERLEGQLKQTRRELQNKSAELYELRTNSAKELHSDHEDLEIKNTVFQLERYKEIISSRNAEIQKLIVEKAELQSKINNSANHTHKTLPNLDINSNHQLSSSGNQLHNSERQNGSISLARSPSSAVLLQKDFEVAKLKQSLSQKQEHIVELQQQRGQWRNKVMDLQNELNTKTENLQLEIKQLEFRNSQLQRRLADSKSEYQILKNAVVETRTRKVNSSSFQPNSQISIGSSPNLQEVTDVLSKQRTQYNQLKERYKDLIQKMKNEQVEMHQRLTEQSEQLVQLQRERDNFEFNYNQTKQILAKTSQALEQASKEYRKRCSQYELEMKSLKQTAHNRTSKQPLVLENNYIRRQTSGTLTAISDYQILREKLSFYELKNQQLQNTINQLQQFNQALSDSLERKTSLARSDPLKKFSNLNPSIIMEPIPLQEIGEVRSQFELSLKETQSKVQVLTVENQSLKQKIRDEYAQEIMRLQKHIQDLEEQSLQMRDNYNRLLDSYAHVTNTSPNPVAKLGTIATRDSQELTVKIMDQSHVVLSSKMANITSQTLTLQSQLSQKQSMIVKLEYECMELSDQVKQLRQLQERHVNVIRELQQHLGIAEETITHLTNSLEAHTLKTQYSETEQNQRICQQLQIQLQDARRDKDQLFKQNQTLAEEVLKLNDIIHKERSKDEEKAMLRQQVARYDQKLEQFANQLKYFQNLNNRLSGQLNQNRETCCFYIQKLKGAVKTLERTFGELHLRNSAQVQVSSRVFDTLSRINSILEQVEAWQEEVQQES